MRIASHPRPRGEQTTLWPWVGVRPLVSNAAKRVAIGAQCEQIVASIFGAERLTLDSRADICPDLRLPTGEWGEVKSCAGEAIVFAHRITKDLRLEKESGHPVLYFYCMHRAAFADISDTAVCATALRAALSSIVVVPARSLWKNKRRAAPGHYYYAADGRTKGAEKVVAWRFRADHLARIAGKAYPYPFDGRIITIRSRSLQVPT